MQRIPVTVWRLGIANPMITVALPFFCSQAAALPCWARENHGDRLAGRLGER
jgi:hypothetical protein